MCRKLKVISFFAAIIVNASVLPMFAQQAPEGRIWVVQQPKYVELTSDGIHFLPKDAKQGPSSVRTALHLQAGKPWSIAFELQLTPGKGAGMDVKLLQQSTTLGWVGAGDYFKHISGFLGTGASSMPYDQPWDTNRHSFEYVSDGSVLSLWHNGVKCGEGALVGTPDTLLIDSTQMEMRVRKLHCQVLPLVNSGPNSANNNLSSSSAVPTESAKLLSPTLAAKDDSTASLGDTLRWICGTINKSAGTLWKDGTDLQRYSDATVDGNNLIFSGKNSILGLIIYTQDTVPLEKMDEDHVRIEKLGASSDLDTVSFRVTVPSLNKAKIVASTFRIYTEEQPNLPLKHEIGSDVDFQFSDRQLAERFEKALRHAIRLCKTNHTNEPF